jgi:HlyD family secretion protein
MNQTLMPSNAPLEEPRARWRVYVGIGVVVALALAAGAWLLGRGHAAAAATAKDAVEPPLITVVIPSRGEVSASVSLTGLISARNDMPIGNEGDAGRIAEVLVEPGDHVRQGQVLARLNPIAAQSMIDNMQASLEQERANAVMAKGEWERAQQGGSDLFSKEENERRRMSATTAEAKVKAAEAQVADARNRLAHTIIRAPTDGIVLTRTAEVGQIAVPGSTVLFRLARDGQIEMRGQVAEQDVPHLKIGQEARVRLDGVSRSFTGTVWQIGAIIDSTTRQGTVRIALPASDQDLRPGAFARAEIQVGSSLGVILPQTAVLSDERGNYVLIVGADSKLERRAVTVGGARSEGLLVSDGLAGTERVVAVAGAFLRTGEVVSIAGHSDAGSSVQKAAMAETKDTVSAQ